VGHGYGYGYGDGEWDGERCEVREVWMVRGELWSGEIELPIDRRWIL